MKVNYNPFFKRASEFFEPDPLFIKLYSIDSLNVFFSDVNKLWNELNIIRSSPGGGKTTLLRLFTPNVLKAIVANKNQDDIKEIYNILTGYEIISNDSPQVVGTIISFIDEYTELDYLDINEIGKTRLFYSLLNSKITISILRSICHLHDLSFPDNLEQIQLVSNEHLPLSLSKATNGKELVEWAYEIEAKICDEIDSLFSEDTSAPGFDSLFILKVLTQANILVNGKPLEKRVLLMFDDVHNLSTNFRMKLMKHIVDIRSNIHIWISERLQALTMSEIFSDGQIEGRDLSIIDLEKHWRDKPSKFAKFAKNVANKRVLSASENEISSFDGCLSEKFSDETISQINEAKGILIDELCKLKENSRYSNWIESRENSSLSGLEELIEWRTLKILIKRDQNKQQKSLNFFELTEDELNEQDGSDVKKAASLFLSKDYNIPYYFGFDTLTRLGSCNIEQFLSISGEIYEIIVSKYFTNNYFNRTKGLSVSPEEQERIINKIAENKFKQLNRRISNSSEVLKFIEAIGKHSQDETYLENAPISPGVNGIAISMDDRNHLNKLILENALGPYKNLAKIIASCISFNLLEVRLNYRCKGKEWMVLYLNRLLCAKYKLPLNYGGFREKKLIDLATWVSNGYVSKNAYNLWKQ